MEDAISVLFWWRETYGFEYSIMFRRRLDIWWSDPSEYETCSEETSEIAFQLVDYRAGGSIDGRSMNYYPLIDRIIEWMDVTYGK